MPIKIIRQNITKIKCCAIVNPTNHKLEPTGGVDLAIHTVAGKELYNECKMLGGLNVGEAKITKGYNLPCKYVIHTVGPRWQGGNNNEEKQLEKCYKSALDLARENNCYEVAFPLIASGLYGFPKEKVLRIAMNTISEFLLNNEMQVYIVVYDKEAYSISEKLYSGISSYIDDNYTDDTFDYVERRARSINDSYEDSSFDDFGIFSNDDFEEFFDDESDDLHICANKQVCKQGSLTSLDNILNNLDKGFAETLFYYIDKKGITDVECYKRANVDKKTFSKIKCNKSYRPSKITAISFVIALHLNLEEANHLLGTLGMCLSSSSIFDLIIKYFIETGSYETIFDVNEALYKFDQATLGV